MSKRTPDEKLLIEDFILFFQAIAVSSKITILFIKVTKQSIPLEQCWHWNARRVWATIQGNHTRHKHWKSFVMGSLIQAWHVLLKRIQPLLFHTVRRSVTQMGTVIQTSPCAQTVSFICLNLMVFWYNVVWQTVISGVCVKNCHHQGTEYTPGQSVTFACPDGTLIEGSESKHEIISCKEVTGGTQFCDSKGVCQIPKCTPGKL